MKKNNFYIVFMMIVLCATCKDKGSDDVYVVKDLVDNGVLFHIMQNDSILVDVGVKDNGELMYVYKPAADHDQLLLFDTITGVLTSKIKKNTATRKTEGRAYYFYRKSGNLSGDFNFVDGIKTGSAVSYHDSTDRIESVMLYNEQGQLYYRKTFDEQGKHIKTEGKK